MAWNYLINFLSYRVPLFERLVSPAPLLVARDGKLLRRNMRREFLTEEELMTYLRKDGYESLGTVKAAYVEGTARSRRWAGTPAFPAPD